MPDMEKVMLDADVEIFNWVLQAEETATATTNREVEPLVKEIAEEDQALEPVHQDNADSDDEIVKVKALTLEDRLEARRLGLSEEPDQDWQDPSYEADNKEEQFTGWDMVEDDKRPPGVVASDPINEADDEFDIDELETVASVEIIEEEEFHDVDEGQAEGIDDDDDDDMAVISKISSLDAFGSKDADARVDPEPMDVDDQGNRMVKSTGTSSVKKWKTSSPSAPAGAVPSGPTDKLKPKAKPAKRPCPSRSSRLLTKATDHGTRSSTRRSSHLPRIWSGSSRAT